ncbi:hypothetical protein CH289_07815 [Rhodococcus sp. RS1C4]|nr:hypothetical protein [Rhodococcus sp. RS1C4]OZC55089.1 hypothetical protein CH289_07815 [Rhodococcus sp. RS1C4]
MDIHVSFGKATIEAFGYVWHTQFFRDTTAVEEPSKAAILANTDNVNGQFDFGFRRPLDYPDERWGRE